MSGLFTPRNIAIASGIGAVILLFPRSQAKVAEMAPAGSNPFETQGVRNVSDRFSSGGGTQTHTPAFGSPRGNARDQSTPHEQKGVGTYQFNKDHADQKIENPNAIAKAYGKAHYGSEKGK